MSIDLKQWAEGELQKATKRVEELRGDGKAYLDALCAVNSLQNILHAEEYLARDPMLNVSPPKPEEILNADAEDITMPEELKTYEPPRPIPKLEAVREKCGEARKKGVDIKTILADMGYKNLSAVDPGDYNALVDKVEAALSEIE